MLPAKKTLAIVALTTTLVGCSQQPLPMATPTMTVSPPRIYTTTTTQPLLTELTSAYTRQQFVEFEPRAGNHQAMLDSLYRGEINTFLTTYLPVDPTIWAAPVGQDALAIVVHKDLEIDNLTMSELRAIFQGRMMNWRAITGTDQNIQVVSRESGSGARAEFERMVMGFRSTTPNSVVASSSFQVVEQVARTPGAIGYVSLGHIQDTVRTVAVDSIEPSLPNVTAKVYPLRSTVYFVGIEGTEDNVLAFINWVQGPDGQSIVAQRYAPLSDMLLTSP